MNKGLFLSLFIGITLWGTDVDTKVAFGAENYVGEDKYGNALYERDVTIQTTDYTVDNFWKKFSFGGKKEDSKSFDLIATTGAIKIKVQSSYACQDGGLDAQGCSGQKPFLINQNTLTNPDMKLDGTGNALPAGEFRIPLDAAGNYNSANDDAFYALDVFRDGEYYIQGGAQDAASAKPTTFFGYIVAVFRDYFSKDVNTYTMGTESPQQRNRYMANITFGLQQDYMLAKKSSVHTNEINTANSSKHVSLLDYNSQIVETTTGCNGLFFSYDPDSLTCKSINLFGMSNFMPFINNTPNVKVKSDSVVEDTETTLLALASKLDGKNYVSSSTYMDTTSGKTSILSEMFKPITFMASSMFRFFFGTKSKNITEMVSAAFDFTNPMPLTFIETDGVSVTSFKHFLLLGLESIYGTEVESCKVKDTKGFMGWASTYQTFTEGEQTNTKFDMEAGFFGSLFNDSSEYSELNVTVEKHKILPFVWVNHDVVNVSTDDWLDWCKRNQGRQKKGLLGRIFDTFTAFSNFIVGRTVGGSTYDEQLDKLLKEENYSVVEYKEKVHKGLILHLKELNGFTPETTGTTSTYQLTDIKRGK